jgi:hypothetical protein
MFKGDSNKYQFETKLLGYANVYNILAAVALGREFGMTIDQLKAGVAKVKAVEHRLELKRKGDITFIDDAYNSNETGFKYALKSLKYFDKKKIIITPGIIELDKENKDICWFIYPTEKDFNNKLVRFTDIISPSIYYQRNIYDITIKNDNLQKLLNTFREDKIFYATDLVGTDFKQVIDFSIRR